MSAQSKTTQSTHVAPTAMSLLLSPLSGSRWRMVIQISSSESISLSLVLFCLAFRAIPTYPCSFDVATTASRIPVMIPKADCLPETFCAICLATHIICDFHSKRIFAIILLFMRFLQVGGPAISSHCYPTFRTVLPRACPVSLSSWARRASESGSTVSTTGFSFPASTSFAISDNCAELGCTDMKAERTL